MSDKSKASFVVIILLFFGSGLSWVLISQSQDTSDSSNMLLSDLPEASNNSDHDRESQNQLTSDVETLKQQLKQLSLSQNSLTESQKNIFQLLKEIQKQSTSVSSETNGQNTDDNGVSKSYNEKVEQEITQKYLTNFENQLLNDEFDEGWRADAEIEINTILEDESLNGSNLTNSECHSKLCKIEVAHSNQDAKEKFFNQFPSLLKWQSDAFMKTTTLIDGSLSTVVYVSRDGYELPGKELLE